MRRGVYHGGVSLLPSALAVPVPAAPGALGCTGPAPRDPSPFMWSVLRTKTGHQEEILTHSLLPLQPSCALLLQPSSHIAITVHRHLPLLSCDSNDLLPSLLSLWSFCSINPSPSIATGLHNFQGFPLTYSGGGCLVAKSCPTLTTPWTVACQASLSMVFSRQEYWRGLPFSSPEDLPNPEIELRSPEL